MKKAAQVPKAPGAPVVKTAAQVRREFEENGVAISEWARLHGFNRNVVCDLLRGRTKAKRGKAHQAAVALGLKPRPINPLKKAA